MTRLVRMGLLAVFLGFLLALPDTTLAQPTGAEVYRDPAGRFTVPIPANWRIADVADYVKLNDPENAIRVYALVVEADDAEQGVAAAWPVVDPVFDGRQVQLE